MRWTWSLCDGFVVFMIYMIYDAYECICVICDIYLFVLMAKQLQAKKINHRGRALHTTKSLFAVCCILRHTVKMVARATWDWLCRVPGQAAHDKASHFCHAPSQAAHSKASHFAVCLVRQHTAKPPILSWAWSGSTRQSIFSWFLKIITLL